MGDPRKIRKNYQTPRHPWVGSRIEEERKLVHEYGLSNKKEVWRMGSLLVSYKDRAKQLLARRDKQSEIEQQQLVDKLVKLGLVKKGATFDEILGLDVRDVLKRRLQSVLIAKHLARSPKQARQMITHRHVTVDDKVVTSPGYLVALSEESTIHFAQRSPFTNEQHPERFSEEELLKQQQKESAKGKKEAGEEEAPLAFSEKDIEKAEVLSGEKKPEENEELVETEKENETSKDEKPKESAKPAEQKAESKPAKNVEDGKESDEKDVAAEPKAEPVKKEQDEKSEATPSEPKVENAAESKPVKSEEDK